MHRLRILIADDYEQMRRAIVGLLESEFEIVGAVGNGKDLIEAAISFQPDVIVSDVSMPILTGTDAMQALRSGWHEVPFVLVSSDTTHAVDWIEQGASAIVDKIDLVHDLMAAVRSVANQGLYLSRSVRSRILPGLSADNSIYFHSGLTDAPIHANGQDLPRIQAGTDLKISYGVD